MAVQGVPTELGTEKISKLLRQYAVPAIIAMTASSLYNMVDSIFIGHGVGKFAIAGLALTFPLMNLGAAFGALVGVGASATISMLLGQKNYDMANKVLGNVVTLNTIIGIVYTIVFLAFLDPILYFFGASENTIGYARDYMTIILFGVRGVMPNFRIYSRYNKDILSYGGWLTGSVIVRRITTELDKFILTRWIPVAQIGAYNRPANFITSIVDRVNGIYDTVLFPILSSYSDDKDKLKDSFLTASSLVSWASMILMAGFVLSAQIIIDIFFGSEWEWLVGIFRILSLSILFLAYSRIGDCYFRSLGWVKAYFYIRLVVCLITLACVSVGCQYGIVGVAISVVVSRVMDSAIKMLYLSIKLSVRFLDLAKAVLTPTWITILVTIGCYLIIRYVPYGEYTAILLFMGVGMILLIAIPQMFGKEYYENVYSVVKSKILSLKK